MKPLIGIIVVVLLGIGEQAIAETDAKRRAELERIIEKLREEAQERKVVLVDKGPGWSRYIFDGQELVIDGDHRKDTVYAFDLSDQTTIDRIVTSVRTIRRYGESCNIVIGFTHERVPAGVGHTTPKTRTLCDSGCFQLREWEKVEYGRRERFIDVQERCTF